MSNEVKADVAIIGSGIAGYSAALFAREAGKTVAVIHNGSGATGSCSGAMDIAGDQSAYPGKPWEKSADVKANLQELVAGNPEHPYGIFCKEGRTEALFDEISTAIDTVKKNLDEAGLHFSGDLERLTPLPTVAGTWKLAALYDEDIAAPQGDSAVVVGIKGLDMSSAGFIAESLKDNADKTWARVPVKYEAVTVAVNGSNGHARGVSFTEALSAWGDEALIDVLTGVAEKHAANSLILPPVLVKSGLCGKLLEKSSGLSSAGMTLAGIPSASGFKLHKAIRESLDSKGITRIKGNVSAYNGSKGRVDSIKVSCIDGSEKLVSAKSYILASGKFLGRGIARDSIFKETIFDLPVFVGGKRVSKDFVGLFVNRKFKSRHELFSAGIKVDGPEMKPVDETGKPVYENLFACGSVIGGYNYIAEGSGMGVGILTGAKAGEAAAKA